MKFYLSLQERNRLQSGNATLIPTKHNFFFEQTQPNTTARPVQWSISAQKYIALVSRLLRSRPTSYRSALMRPMPSSSLLPPRRTHVSSSSSSLQISAPLLATMTLGRRCCGCLPIMVGRVDSVPHLAHHHVPHFSVYRPIAALKSFVCTSTV